MNLWCYPEKEVSPSCHSHGNGNPVKAIGYQQEAFPGSPSPFTRGQAFKGMTNCYKVPGLTWFSDPPSEEARSFGDDKPDAAFSNKR